MSANKSQRITIRPHNIDFLTVLASQMGIDNLSEVINYLILDCKGLGYSFGNKPTPTPHQAPLGYTFDTSSFEKSVPVPDVERNYQESDPVIARLANLLEDF
jgi:hypothetical protein